MSQSPSVDEHRETTTSGRYTRAVKGILVAVGSFLLLGTVSALWQNPLFMRMAPAGDLEIAVLLAMSSLLGLYVAVKRPYCSIKAAGSGGVLGFIGIACPVCNNVLLLLFGGELLMTYFEPVRIYVAILGTLLMAAALWWEWRQRQKMAPASDLEVTVKGSRTVTHR